jgi:hypothetical protein
MPATYEPIATTTLSSAAAEITFSSISSAYTDLRLVVVWQGTQSGSSNNIMGRFNGDTATNYSNTDLNGSGTAAASNRGTNQTRMNFGFVASTEGTNWGLANIDIFNYAGSTNKTVLCAHSYDRNGSGYVQRNVNLWRSTSAITSITILSNVNNLAAGTTATLYGILKA